MNEVLVVIPNHNRSVELKRAINSVISQSYYPIFLVIVDDGSSSEYQFKNHELYSKYPTIFNLAQMGAAYSRNIGSRYLDAQYIAFLDSDDEWLPDHVFKAVKAINDNKADFSISWFYNHVNSVDVLPSFKSVPKQEKIDFARLLLGRNKFDARTSTMVFRKSVFDKLLFDEKLGKHQDWDLFLRAINGFKCVVVEEPTVRLYVEKNRKRMSNFYDFRASWIFYKKHANHMSFDLAVYFWVKRIYSALINQIGSNR
jgi:glycosyltransferase involved in cell wall biosynthesis